MIEEKIPTFYAQKLVCVGIDPVKCNEFQILCLPENFQISSREDLFDADLSCDLSKALKQRGLKCANSYDLDIDCKTAIRQSHEMFFGVVWILEKVAVPIFTTVVSTWLINKRNSKNDRNTVHIEIHYPNSDIIKYNGDAETLIALLKREEKSLEEHS